jgi:hypothetical protein
MNPKDTDLEKLNFSIPPLWKKDWKQAISNAQGVEKNILIIQKRAAGLLYKINEKRVTFARLAWLIFFGQRLLPHWRVSFALCQKNHFMSSVYLAGHHLSRPYRPKA